MNDSRKYHRRSIRLPGYDYAADGLYFVTLCIQHREQILGKIEDGQVVLSSWGQVVAGCWLWLAEQYPYVTLDEWVIMPNHLHGIVIISDKGGSHEGDGGATPYRTAPTKSLGRLIGAFKTVSTKKINQLRQAPQAVLWQRNYYEHVIRDERALDAIRQYIKNNPFNWAQDAYFSL